jgi:protein TonB
MIPRHYPAARALSLVPWILVPALAVVFVSAAPLLVTTTLAGPATGGSPKLQVFFAADFTDVPYQQGVYKKVAGAWKWPAEAPKPGSKAVVIVTIQKSGTSSQPALHMKSGSDAWDAAAMEAVRRAAPFDPLPASYRPPSVEVHFHFGYEK